MPQSGGDPLRCSVVALDLRLGELGREVLAVQHAAYAAEAALVGDDRIPPLAEDLDALLAADLRWWGAVTGTGDDGRRVVGALAYRLTADLCDVHRLVVHPRVSRRGVGRRLVRALPTDRRTTVGTALANDPAVRLYEGEGFHRTGTSEPVPGLVLVHLERSARG